MTSVINHLLVWLLTYQYAVLVPAMIIEAPMATVLAGFLVSLGFFNGVIVYLIAVIVNAVSDSAYYAVGRWGRLELLNRWGKYVGLDAAKVRTFEADFAEHTTGILIAGKAAQGLGGIILLAAGAAHVPFRRFLWINFLCTIPKMLILLLLGFYFGQAYEQIDRYLRYGTLALTILIVIFIVGYMIIVKKVAKKMLAKNHVTV
jgi:membrane protein DedA with SNARE-associated domain